MQIYDEQHNLMVEPMKKWTVTYDGPMINRDTREKHNVIIKVKYVHSNNIT